MPTPFTLPIPKIGNHPLECPCGTCDNARKRLANSPYVQLLQRELLAAHNRLGASAATTPDLTLEHKILDLTDQLTKSRDAERVMTNTLTESRKLAQEREAQLSKVQQALRGTEDKFNIASVQLRNAQDENHSLKESLKAAQAVKDLTADELDAALAQVDGLAQRCNLYKGQAERIGEANTNLQTELKAITEEANNQRKAAGEARAALKMAQAALTHSSESLEQERRAGLVETVLVMIGTAFVVGLAAWLVGRFGR